MFRKLKPILSTRSLVISVMAVSEDIIRLTIAPRAMAKDDSKAPSVPFVVEGTAAELDAELPAALVSYTAEQLNCTRAVERVREAAEAELKTVKEEAARRVADAKKSGGAKIGTPNKPREDTPVKPTPEPKKPDPPAMLNLFGGDGAEDESSSSANTATPATSTAGAQEVETTDEDDEEQSLFREASFDGVEDEDVAA